MIRWGVLSTAKIATSQAIPALMSAEGCVVSAIASRSEGRAREVAGIFAIPNVFASYEALLASDDVDAVYLPLPTSQHVEWSMKAANAGKHVLCEKPISLSAQQIKGLKSAAAANNVIVSEAMMVAYHPQWSKVRELIETGAIGALKHVRASFSYFNIDPNNMRNRLELGGGVLPDIGCYPIATTRLVTGANAKQVFATEERDPKFGTDIYVSAMVDFGSFDLSMQVGTQLAWRQTSSFHGDKGFIEIVAPFNAVPNTPDCVRLFSDAREVPEEFTFPDVNQFKLQFEAFAQAVMTGDRNGLLSLDKSMQNQLIIDAIYKLDDAKEWMAVS